MVKFTVKRGEPTLVPPAEETPNGLYFLSNLDHNFLAVVPTLFVYRSEEKSNEKAATVIKDALAKILVHYYPLAGRMIRNSEGKLMVDCNREGGVFVEAEANSSIEIMGDNRMPDPSIHGKLFYDCPDAKDILEKPFVSVQVTKFKCGAFVVGVATNHSLLDGSSAMEFLSAWSETARGLPLKFPPYLDRTILKARNPPKIKFPHHEYYPIEDISNMSDIDNEEFMYSSFIFDSDKLNQLKMKANEYDGLVKASSFETLVAFLWRARCQALKLHSDQEVKLLLLVDGRSKLNPPIPEGFCGNGVVLASSLGSAGEIIDNPLGYTVGLVREAIKMVSDSYIRSCIDYYEVTRASHSMTAAVSITTWCRIPFHTIDFGWGKTIACGKATLPRKTTILFLPHGKDMRNINVIVGLPVSAMKIFKDLMEI